MLVLVLAADTQDAIAVQHAVEDRAAIGGVIAAQNADTGKDAAVIADSDSRAVEHIDIAQVHDIANGGDEAGDIAEQVVGALGKESAGMSARRAASPRSGSPHWTP